MVSLSVYFRQFMLINDVGEEYDLTDPNHFFANPDGLGFEREYSSLQTGDAFVAIENKLKQQKVTGEMIFLNYEEYADFSRFIATGGLVLAYRPAGFSEWYYRSCKGYSVKKSEISTSTGRLHCNVDFICFSQWYERVIAERTVYEISENSVFPLTFPFVFADRNINEIILNNTGAVPAPCKICLLGPCTNPAWTLYHEGRAILNGAMLITLQEGDCLIVDANIESMRIVVDRDGEESDAYQNSDFSTDRFVYAPSGRSLLRFSHSTTDALDVTVEVRKISDTV